VIEGLDYDPTRLLGNLLTMRFWIEISHFSENKEQKVLKVTNFEICGYFISRSSRFVGIGNCQMFSFKEPNNRQGYLSCFEDDYFLHLVTDDRYFWLSPVMDDRQLRYLKKT
jgi:hypothetical protein